jgi:hypothetical protein
MIATSVFRKINSTSHYFEYLLIGISSTLLGIWAVRDKISLQATPGSTHSAWIEFILAFGLPGLILLFGLLLLILYLTITSPNSYFRTSVISIAVTIIVLCALGELSTQHGVEVLFYSMAFLASLHMPLDCIRSGAQDVILVHKL